MRFVESEHLYHTAPAHALPRIFADLCLSPRSGGAGFLSFSERPLVKYKTSQGGAVFVFSKQDLEQWVMPVEYDREFLARYPLQGAYVAHYANPKSFLVPPLDKLDYDRDDPVWEVYGSKAHLYRAFLDVADQLRAFRSEKEWVTRKAWQRISIQEPYLVRILVAGKTRMQQDVRKMAEAANIRVPVERV